MTIIYLFVYSKLSYKEDNMKEYFGDCDNFCIQEGFIQIFDFTGGDFNSKNIVINNQLKHRYPAINIIKNKIEGFGENELILNEEEIIRLIIDGVIYEDCIELVTCSKREIEFPTIYINLSNQEIPIKISCIKNYQPPCKDRC